MQAPKIVPAPEIVSRGFDDYDDYDVKNSAPVNKTTDYDSEEDLVTASGGDTENLKKAIEPLPRVDHSQINYRAFVKNLYRPSNATNAITESEVESLRQELEISVSASDAPKPIRTFADAGFDLKLRQEIEKNGFQHPTAIQAQALPIALSGLDVIGLAKTGSGKTLAYVWPILTHVLAQPQMQVGDGPIALVLAPTRELVVQILAEAKRYAKLYNIRCVAIFGGAGKWEMTKALRDETPEVVVATPGRFIEMIRIKATNLQRCTFVVLDEADRMFDMGFEYQMRSIIQNIRPDRQCLMFSATMKRRIEDFAREMLQPQSVRIVVGTIGQANPDIRQQVQLVASDEEKWLWLSTEIDAFAAEGKVLIFVLSKADTEVLTLRLKTLFARRELDVGVDCLHGDKDSFERSKIMRRFGNKNNTVSSNNTSGHADDAITILVATDLAARGLDVRDIRTVINYDVAKNIETYVHRIGRTGRMGIAGVVPGTAYTLLTPKDSSFACDLVQNLRLSQQAVSEGLLALASQDSKWHRMRHNGGGRGGSHRSSHSSVVASSGGNVSRSGLGTSSAGRAMTSAMLAGVADRSAVHIPTGHSASSSAVYDTLPASATTVNTSDVQPGSVRKSRFASTPSSSLHDDASSSSQPVVPIPPIRPPMTTGTTALKGFVKASGTSTSTSSSFVPASSSDARQSGNETRKRSRWDS